MLDDDVSVKDFCNSVGIDVMTFFNICENKYIPNLEISLKIANVLKCHVNDIFILDEKEV